MAGGRTSPQAWREANGIRVLHLLPHVRRVGNGIVDVTVDLMLAQAAAGHEVHVISPGGEYENLLSDHGVFCHRGRLHPRDWRALRTTVRSVEPHLMHAHTLKGAVSARVVSPRTPLVTTVHRQPGPYASVLNIADRIIAVSEGNQNTFRRSILGDKIRIVMNGVVGSVRRAEHLAAAPVDLPSSSVLFVGGLYDRKGLEPLLRAFATLQSVHPERGAHLIIVGEGPRRGVLESLAENLGLAESVRFLGFRSDATAFIRACDVFVLPSLDEPFGLVLAEARELGVAIVASDVGGIPQVLENGRAGVLVPAGDSEALSHAIHRLLDDDDLRKKYRDAARDNLGWLSVQRMYQETMSVYRQATGER